MTTYDFGTRPGDEITSHNNSALPAGPDAAELLADLTPPPRDNAPPVTRSTTDKPDPNYVSVSVYLKSKATDGEIEKTLQDIDAGKQKDYSQDQQAFIDKFGAAPKSLAKLEQFAAANNLKVTSQDLASGQVVLSGQATDFGKAFNIYMSTYKDLDGHDIIRHKAPIPIPASLSDTINGVFGLTPMVDGTPLNSREAPVKHQATGDGGTIQTYLPTDVAKLYDFPIKTGGAGQGVAIIEVDGGLDLKDNQQYYQEHNLPVPKIDIVEIDGAKNHSDSSDDEVALDSQIVGAVAPKAEQHVIFTPNEKRGFIDGITRSTFQPEGETKNASVSLSWGMPESEWDADAQHVMRLAIEKAALKGINVYVASGDSGSQASSSDISNQTQFPASAPEAIAVGGTSLISKDGQIIKETAWNDGTHGDFFGNRNLTASGGGISDAFPVPFYQRDITLPGDKSVLKGRGVPDIAGNADDRTPYQIRVNGKDSVGDGTSAATPLYAAYNALINAENGGKSWGWLLPKIYKIAATQPQAFNDITEGNNGTYKAGPGWDAVTGWGSIRGNAFLDALRKDAAADH